MAESLRELNDALDALSYELLQACERYVASRSPKDFQAWLTVNARYVALHREWWALAMPDVAYDSVFAPQAHLEQHRQEDPHELSRVRHELWQRDSECKALSEAKHTAERKLAEAERVRLEHARRSLEAQAARDAAEARVRELEDMLQDADNANLTALRRAELDLSGERANHDCTVADAQKAINKLESELAQLRERVAKALGFCRDHSLNAGVLADCVEDALRGN